MKAFAILLAAILSFGIVGMILAGTSDVTFAQMSPPLPTNGTDLGGNTTIPEPSMPLPEPIPVPEPVPVPAPTPPETPSGNETTDEISVDQPPEEISSTNRCIEHDVETDIVHIVCDADIYELFAGLRDDSITQQLGFGEILINANITVDDGATFSINSDRGINYVKIADGQGITVLGAIHIDDIKLTSWDPTSSKVIRQDETGSTKRAFLLLSESEGGHIFNSELGYMGYNATGYRGVDLIEDSHDFGIINSTFHNMWYAFYSNAAYNITIDSSEYHDNHQYAVDPHTGTHNMTISNNTVHSNPVGLVCSLDCYDILFEGNTIYNNTGAGIFFSRNTYDSIARNNTIYDQPIGIAFSESPNNQVYGNNIYSVGRGIVFNNPEFQDDGSAINNRVYDNTISDSTVGIVAFRSADNIVSDNLLRNITMSHYRLDAGASLTISSQTFEKDTIEGREGENTVNFANMSSSIMIDAETYDASMQHSVKLTNQTIMVSSVPRD
jgi:parallel beta-helix repeat protein